MLVASANGTILGAGCVRIDDWVVLNYVAPEARFQGVSSALMAALERQAEADGHAETGLDSTTTSRTFYLNRGYQTAGEPIGRFGLNAHPMRKRL